MCGIFAIFSKQPENWQSKRMLGKYSTFRQLAYGQSILQRHRGPDSTGVLILPEDGVAMVHERLRIIGVQTGDQPLFSQDGNISLVANGEIYNYLALSEQIAQKRGPYKPKSDSNVIIELYEEYGIGLLEHIKGMFAFVLYDKINKKLMIARDPFGIIPLYKGEDRNGNIWFASEMKCLLEFCEKVQIFPPGHFAYGSVNQLKFKRYFDPIWRHEIPSMPINLQMLRQKLETATKSHLQCDVPFGCLLSGGVDSSLIAALATKVKRAVDPHYRLKTFAVGMPGSPDFKHAKLVAEHIGSEHTEVCFAIENCLDGLPELIYHLESYDVSTVRCSLPMFYLVRHIKSTGIKMILSGEGADEIFGGYLYFFQAPNATQFHQEMVSRLENLHVSDILRANKVTMSHGLELRVPFLDTDVVNYVMSVRPLDKIPGPLNCLNDQRDARMEKYVLRKAFDQYLPEEVIWRQKEQFSDGVGYDLLEAVPLYAAAHVSDAEMSNASEKFPINTPVNKEAYYYRSIFDKMFPGKAASETVEKWLPRADWGCPTDPSGRAQKAHQQPFNIKS